MLCVIALWDAGNRIGIVPAAELRNYSECVCERGVMSVYYSVFF